MSTHIGTPLYMAPEILQGKKYSEAVDWWSIGIILYICLCGSPPFASMTQTELLSEIKETGVQFDEDWDQISESAKDLVSRLLNFDPTKRITSYAETSNHEWMTDSAPGKELHTQMNLKNNLHKIKRVIKAANIIRKLA